MSGAFFRGIMREPRTAPHGETDRRTRIRLQWRPLFFTNSRAPGFAVAGGLILTPFMSRRALFSEMGMGISVHELRVRVFCFVAGVCLALGAGAVCL